MTESNIRPKSYRERQLQAEEKYSELYAKFRTHNFLDWGILTEFQEKGASRMVPPYSYRFDEFIVFWAGSGEPTDIPALMEDFFPNPDEIDCDYIQDLIDEMERIGTFGKQIYKAGKGSKLDMGPALCFFYHENVARTKKWLQRVEARLNATPSPSAPKRATIAIKDDAAWDGLFLNGFTVERLTSLLINLDILDSNKKSTSYSQPRNWMAAIEALRKSKFLVFGDNKTLHKSLVSEYGKHNGVPSLRAVQDGHKSTSAYAIHNYERALALLKAQ